MKKAWVICTVLLLAISLFIGCAAPQGEPEAPQEKEPTLMETYMQDGTLRILNIGNSFTSDTLRLLPNVARALGITNFEIAYLYRSGGSTNMHYNNAVTDAMDYTYYYDDGHGWVTEKDATISSALKRSQWDLICFQHGSSDGSRYTKPECYDKLPALKEYVKGFVGENVVYGFNMAWAPEPECTRPEMKSFNGDQKLMYETMMQVTETVVAPMVDMVCPVGTAVQNARPYISKKLTRDDFHLSKDLGRYLAALTFLKTMCGVDIDGIQWMPEGVTEEERDIAVKAINAAAQTPYAVTALQ